MKLQERFENMAMRVIEWIGSTASLIVHTIFFLFMLALRLFGWSGVDVMLILTTIVSLEAVYLAILNQMTLNRHTKSIQEVQSDVETLTEDVEEMMEDES